MKAGTTHDGYEVGPEYRLRFLPMCFSGFRFERSRMLGLLLEFNQTATGGHRPYYVLWLLGLSLTGGWIFDKSESGASQKERA